MMKRYFILILCLCSLLSVSAQKMTKKWNDFYKRTEYFDSNGRLIGWEKYNDF